MFKISWGKIFFCSAVVILTIGIQILASSSGVSIVYTSMADHLVRQGDFQRAEEYFVRNIELLEHHHADAASLTHAYVRYGHFLFDREAMDSAADYFKKAMEIAPEDSSDLPHLWYLLGSVQVSQREWASAESSLLKARELMIKRGMKGTLPAVEGVLANLYQVQGNEKRSDEHYLAALQGVNATEDPQMRVAIYADRALFCQQRGDWEEAERLLRMALDDSEIHSHLKAGIQGMLGESLHRQGRLAEAEASYLKAAEIYDARGAIIKASVARACHADILALLGRVAEAEEEYRSILRHVSSLESSPIVLQEQAQANRDLALFLERYKKERHAALIHLQKAVDLSPGGSLLEAMNRHSQGILLVKESRFEEAGHSFRHALRIYRKHEAKGRIPGVYNSLAQLALTEGNLDEARLYAEEGLAALRQNNGPRQDRAYLFDTMASIAKGQGALEEAVKWQERAVEHVKLAHDKQRAGDFFRRLGELYRTQGRTSEARAAWAEAKAYYTASHDNPRLNALEAQIRG